MHHSTKTKYKVPHGHTLYIHAGPTPRRTPWTWRTAPPWSGTATTRSSPPGPASPGSARSPGRSRTSGAQVQGWPPKPIRPGLPGASTARQCSTTCPRQSGNERHLRFIGKRYELFKMKKKTLNLTKTFPFPSGTAASLP